MPILHLHIKPDLRTIPVFINKNVWQGINGFLAEQFPRHSIFMVADSHVAGIYAGQAEEALAGHPGFRDILVFPAGEKSKSRRQAALLEDRLLEKKAGRDTVLLAMGGGVTGDLVGFVASVLHRGVELIHIPTSLLAQVDSSIGGKVGINHPAGKNLLGAFYQPAAIFTDPDLLATLPNEELRNGLAEVVKYAVILDEELWEWLETGAERLLRRDARLLEKIVMRCVQLKIQVVEADERENFYRSILNFGHTVGHAIEKLSKFRVKHGFAVAAGMLVAARLSHQLLGYPAEMVERLHQTLQIFGLDTVNIGNFAPDLIWEAVLGDKKSRQQIPRFTLISSPGNPELFHPVTKEELEIALAAC